MTYLHDRHVVLTGSSSGIGASLARAFAREGARLTLVARRRAELERLAAECGGRCFVLPRDLSEPPAEGWLAEAQAALGPVDVVVNNAGMENSGPTATSNIDVGRRLLRLNLETPLVMTRQLLPGLVARRGAVVNVASVAGLAPAPLQAWYGASKAGLSAFSEALRGELSGTGLRVLTVYPGPVTTPMAEAGYAAFGGRKGLVGLLPEGKPDELAGLIVRALGRNQARLIYPRFYTLTRLAPWFARWATDRAVAGRLAASDGHK